jgi:hypothetical protein
VDLELMSIEDQVVKAITLVDFGGDGDGSLVSKLAAKLNVVEGNSVVGRLSPGIVMSVWELLRHCLKLSYDQQAYQAGRISLSEAMFTKLLVTSL